MKTGVHDTTVTSYVHMGVACQSNGKVTSSTVKHVYLVSTPNPKPILGSLAKKSGSVHSGPKVRNYRLIVTAM